MISDDAVSPIVGTILLTIIAIIAFSSIYLYATESTYSFFQVSGIYSDIIGFQDCNKVTLSHNGGEMVSEYEIRVNDELIYKGCNWCIGRDIPITLTTKSEIMVSTKENILFYGVFTPYNKSKNPTEPPTYNILVDNKRNSSWYNANQVKTIEEGINNASVDWNIYVFNGTYNEKIIIDKTVNLIGEDRNSTTISAQQTGRPVLIDAPYVNFSGFKVMRANNLNYGIQILSDFNHIFDNWITLNGNDGLIIWSSSINNSILGNIIISNTAGCGIQIYKSSGNIIKNNLFKSNKNGIVIDASVNNTISENNILNNSNCGIYISGDGLNFIYRNNIKNNNWNAYVYGGFVNCWNTTTEGNFWSDYGGGGIYPIEINNFDYHPLEEEV